ncbi:MAG: flagellar hook-associated protein FlgK [Methylococcaceae bacterium]|jgi:flagellar hook-associated protein 1 FlgK
MTSILGTALSGLAAFQRSLDTTSNNIANVDTEGYNRQRVELTSRDSVSIGSGFIGQGVNVANVSRIYDQFISGQVRSSTTAFNQADAYQTLASQVDNVIGDPTTGLAPILTAFFDSANKVANNPASIPARQVFLSNADSVSQQFNNVAHQFDTLRSQTNANLQVSVDDINADAKAIVELNKQIVIATGQATGGQQPNDLLDKRDALLNKLAENIDISVVPQQNGAVSVFVGQGQTLVLGGSNQASTLSLADSSTDPQHKEIQLNNQTITSQITGGKLGGNLSFRDNVLDPSQLQLGVLATTFAETVNNQHALGYDLSGIAGANLFSLGSQPITVVQNPNLSGGGSISASLDSTNPQALQASDYRLDYNGSSYSLTRLSDNQNIALPGFPGASVSVDGFVLQQTTAPTGASSFLIRPAFSGAQNISAALTDPTKVAAAGSSSSGPGDNVNALSLAGLASATVLNGSTTFASGYGNLASNVGALTNAATINRSAQNTLLTQTQQSQASISGVNLDEEAANLIKFQNAYQAAAQAISVSRSVFDTLIGAFR